MKMFFRRVAFVFALMTFSINAFADEIMLSIDEAAKYYKDGRYSAALESLDYASQLMRQKRADTLETFLPEALPGWKGQDVSSESVGPAMLGGMFSAQRTYLKDTSRITVSITDSPAFQSIMKMFSTLMLSATGSGRLKRIKGQKANIRYDADRREGEITVMVADQCMVTVKGKNVSKDELLSYASVVDYDKLKNF